MGVFWSNKDFISDNDKIQITLRFRQFYNINNWNNILETTLNPLGNIYKFDHVILYQHSAVFYFNKFHGSGFCSNIPIDIILQLSTGFMNIVNKYCNVPNNAYIEGSMGGNVHENGKYIINKTEHVSMEEFLKMII